MTIVPTRVTLIGHAAHPASVRVQKQITAFAWAALRQQRYAEGTECRVIVVEGHDNYEISASAQEPGGPPLRLFGLTFPKEGLSDEDFSRLAVENGLSDFLNPEDGSIVVGGTPGGPPDLVQCGRPGRNDLCPCGSGKKYKKCCLQ